MLVARYWAEVKVEGVKPNGRKTSVRRFGCSATSEEDARLHAESRAQADLARRLAGEDVPSRERSVPYGAADGLPIREEIIEEAGEAVVTRNCYGALCLNTPDVLFADVDTVTGGGSASGVVVAVLSAVGLAAFAFHLAVAGNMLGAGLALGGAVAMGITCWPLARRSSAAAARESDAAFSSALERVRGFVATHPDWLVRAYRTPNGLRLLALHARFDPMSDQTAEFFADIGADTMYAWLCRLQRCFRARLTPKPWRIAIPEERAWRSRRWPFLTPDQVARREAWVRKYDAARQGHAACAFIETLGRGLPERGCEQVREFHDRLAGATSGLPIA